MSFEILKTDLIGNESYQNDLERNHIVISSVICRVFCFESFFYTTNEILGIQYFVLVIQCGNNTLIGLHLNVTYIEVLRDSVIPFNCHLQGFGIISINQERGIECWLRNLVIISLQ